jgi:hypothetical protein
MPDPLADETWRRGRGTDPSLLPPPRLRAKASEFELEEAIFAIRASASVQTERLQAVMDGAMLGAEQVQDKQLELAMEEVKRVSAEEAFAIFLFMFALEAPIAAGVIGAAYRAILTPVLRSRFSFNRLPKSFQGAEISSFLRSLRAPGEPQAERVFADWFERDALRKIGPRDFSLYAEQIQDWLAKPAEYTVVGLKAGAASNPVAAMRQPASPTPSDTPGVGVRGAIMALVANQRASISVTHSRFEQIARLGLLDREGLASLLQLIAWEELPMSLDKFRGGCKEIFEAVIWAQLYGFDFKKGRPARVPTFPLGFEISGVPGELVEYWGLRFDERIQAWSQEAARRGDRDSNGARIQPLTGSIKNAQPIQRRVYLIHEFLMSTSKDVRKLPAQAFLTASGAD